MKTRRKTFLTAIAAGAGLVLAAHAASAQPSPPPLTPEQIKRLDEASAAMPAYPYSFYRTQESFARINPPPV